MRQKKTPAFIRHQACSSQSSLCKERNNLFTGNKTEVSKNKAQR